MPILFDLDGTLLDTAPDFTFILNQMRQEHDLPPLPMEVFKPAISEGLESLITLSFNLSIEHPQHQRLGAQFLEHYQQLAGRYTKPFPGMLDLLSTLERIHIPWGVVTNKKTGFTKSILTSVGLIERAACIVGGDTTPYSKPHPAPLIYASQFLGVSPEKCIYIGDALRDIQAGKAAGMTTIGVLFGYIISIETAMQWQADYYATTVEDIFPAIQKRYSL